MLKKSNEHSEIEKYNNTLSKPQNSLDEFNSMWNTVYFIQTQDQFKKKERKKRKKTQTETQKCGERVRKQNET